MKRTAMVAVAVAMLSTAAASAADFAPNVDDKGTISLPKDLRARLTHLGSWVVGDPDAPGHGFHDVYADDKAVAAFRMTGKFPDGSVLVKEIRTIAKGDLTTGNGVNWADKPVQWFVMVKDAKGRFPGNRNWGDGWGWALFMADDPARNVSADYQADCMGCHTPAAATDWVFVQGYPTLAK